MSDGNYEVYRRAGSGDNFYPIKVDGTHGFGNAPVATFGPRAGSGLTAAAEEAIAFLATLGRSYHIMDGELLLVRCINGGAAMFTVTIPPVPKHVLTRTVLP